MRTISPNLKLLIFWQFVVGAVGAWIGAALQGPPMGISFGVGAALMLFNVAVLGWSSRRLFAKKSIAWTTLLIVIKYAVLLSSIYYLARTEWFVPTGAGLGIVSFVVAALLMAWQTSRLQNTR